MNVSSLVEANLDFTKLIHVGSRFEKAVEKMLKGLIRKLGHVKELTIGGALSEVKFTSFENLRVCRNHMISLLSIHN